MEIYIDYQLIVQYTLYIIHFLRIFFLISYLESILRNQARCMRNTRHATSSGVGLMRGGLWGKIEMEGNRLGRGARISRVPIHYHGISPASCIALLHKLIRALSTMISYLVEESKIGEHDITHDT